MPVIFESQLKSELSKDIIKSVYVLFGEDSYLLKHYETVIIDKTCGADNEFDLGKFERDVDLQAVFDAVNQFPMMSARKCVILYDYDFENASKSDFERLIEILSDCADFSTLVLRFDAVIFDPKRSARAKKIITAVEKCGGEVAEIRHRSDAELAEMLRGGAKKRGHILDIKIAKYIIENCGLDINTLADELEKLCFYVEVEQITAEDVDKVCVKSVEASVYEYVKKMIECDVCGALNDLDGLFYMKFEPMIIIYTVASAFVDMMRVQAARDTGKAVSDVAKDFSYGNKAFALDKAARNLRRMGGKKLKLCAEEVLRADNLLKSFSYEPRFILEQMTVKIIHIVSTGEQIDKN